MTTIVTHVSPDWDAITAAWLLKRYANGFQDAGIALVNTGNPDPAILAAADAVVDTGKVFDRSRLRFDHHQWPNHQTSAAQLVWEYLCEAEHYLPALRPMIELVTAGDLGLPAAKWSREQGIHAVLSAWKAQRLPDIDLLACGFVLLDALDNLLARGTPFTGAVRGALMDYADDLAAHAQANQEARDALARHTVYKSADGLLIALENAPQQATFAAMEAGARLVVFHSDYPSIPTVAVGCSRAAEWDAPHVGEIVEKAQEADSIEWMSKIPIGGDPIDYKPSQLSCELRAWYYHPAGFFAGRGTPKAPDNRPLEVPIATIAATLDACWLR